MRIVKVAPMWRLKVLVQWKLNTAGVFERPFWGAFLLHRLSEVPSTIVAPHTIFIKTFPPNGYIWIWSELAQIVKALFSIKEWQNF